MKHKTPTCEPPSCLTSCVGTGLEASQFDVNGELQKLQREVELLRLKDLQQEHHISMLTEQLRIVQAEPPEVLHNALLLMQS